MTISLPQQQWWQFLQTNSIVGLDGTIYHDYRAPASILFIFPYYIQLGLIQIISTLEQTIVEQWNLPSQPNLIQPVSTLQLMYQLLGSSLPPITSSILTPNLNVQQYNQLFGFSVDPTCLLSATSYTPNSSSLTSSTLFSAQSTILPRDRVTTFFSEVNYTLEAVDTFTSILVNNDRMTAAAVFCSYFNYTPSLTQTYIGQLETWLLTH